MTHANRKRMEAEIKPLLDKHLEKVSAIRKKYEDAGHSLDGPAEREIRALERENFKKAADIRKKYGFE